MTVHCNALESQTLFESFTNEYQSTILKDEIQCHLFWQRLGKWLKLGALPYRQDDHTAAEAAEKFLAGWTIQFLKEGRTLVEYFSFLSGTGSHIHSSFAEIDQLIAEEAAKVNRLSTPVNHSFEFGN